MAVDGGYGVKGYPKFDPNGAPEDWVDLEAVGQYAALVGNRMAGTRAERNALSSVTTEQKQRWDGLEFHETDTGLDWRYVSGAWRGASPWGGLKAGTTNASGIITVAHPWGVKPETVLANMHYLEGDSLDLPLYFEPVVWIVDGANIQLRFKRTDTVAWAATDQPLAFMLATWA